jgi:hypothetical protein
MISPCNVPTKGFNIFDYDTRATLNGFTHEVASGHLTTKWARSVSAIHGSTTIIGDHDDSLFELYVGDFSITTGTFPKFFVTSNNGMADLNYIEGTVLVMATAYSTPLNIEIHITS